MIEAIKVSGVAIGGSTGCTTCPKGYVSDESSSMCAACPPGKFTLFPGMAVCTPCTPGQYAPGWASDSCRRCGHGTHSGIGATSCDVSSAHCQYKVDDNTVYDLHQLAKINEPMYGPVEDTNNGYHAQQTWSTCKRSAVPWCAVVCMRAQRQSSPLPPPGPVTFATHGRGHWAQAASSPWAADACGDLLALAHWQRQILCQPVRTNAHEHHVSGARRGAHLRSSLPARHGHGQYIRPELCRGARRHHGLLRPPGADLAARWPHGVYSGAARPLGG